MASEVFRDWGVRRRVDPFSGGLSLLSPLGILRGACGRLFSADARLPGPDKAASELVRGPPIRSSPAVPGSWAARLRDAGSLGGLGLKRSGSQRSQGPFGEWIRQSEGLETEGGGGQDLGNDCVHPDWKEIAFWVLPPSPVPSEFHKDLELVFKEILL